ncbi:hypothetical protein LXL04_020512 [Taraxacum kok-saghyz]
MSSNHKSSFLPQISGSYMLERAIDPSCRPILFSRFQETMLPISPFISVQLDCSFNQSPFLKMQELFIELKAELRLNIMRFDFQLFAYHRS